MVKQLLPSEIHVWYVLPVIRKHLAQALVKQGSTQRRAAELLGITPAAVSQYLNEKRAGNFPLTEELKERVEEVAEELQAGKTLLEAQMELLHHKEMTKLICRYHMDNDPDVPENCRICMEVHE